jgi:hypothetical protein
MASPTPGIRDTKMTRSSSRQLESRAATGGDTATGTTLVLAPRAASGLSFVSLRTLLAAGSTVRPKSDRSPPSSHMSVSLHSKPGSMTKAPAHQWAAPFYFYTRFQWKHTNKTKAAPQRTHWTALSAMSSTGARVMYEAIGGGNEKHRTIAAVPIGVHIRSQAIGDTNGRAKAIAESPIGLIRSCNGVAPSLLHWISDCRALTQGPLPFLLPVGGGTGTAPYR